MAGVSEFSGLVKSSHDCTLAVPSMPFLQEAALTMIITHGYMRAGCEAPRGVRQVTALY
jgi:hypothetical protein